MSWSLPSIPLSSTFGAGVLFCLSWLHMREACLANKTTNPWRQGLCFSISYNLCFVNLAILFLSIHQKTRPTSHWTCLWKGKTEDWFSCPGGHRMVEVWQHEDTMLIYLSSWELGLRKRDKAWNESGDFTSATVFFLLQILLKSGKGLVKVVSGWQCW
jgi:hypothetical protein